MRVIKPDECWEDGEDSESHHMKQNRPKKEIRRFLFIIHLSLFSFAAGTLLLVTVSWILYQVGKKNALITLSNAVPVTITLLSWIPFLIYVPYGLIAIPIKLIS